MTAKCLKCSFGASACVKIRLYAIKETYAQTENVSHSQITPSSIKDLQKPLCFGGDMVISAFLHCKSNVNAQKFAFESLLA